jgi:nucleoside-diphosphate kinase
VVVCYNRQLKIVAFGDEFTRKELVGEDTSSRTYGMLKPNAYLNFGKMIAATEKEFTLANLKMFQFDEDSAGQFYGEHKGKGFYPTLINFMTSDFSVGMELLAPNVITKWRKFIGPTNSQKAREEAPTSLRALYGEDGTKNACHGSDAPSSAEREIGLVFSGQAVVRSRPYFENCSLMLIKPHAVKGKLVGEVVDCLLSSGFEVSAMQMIWFDHAAAQEFYEPYKFLPEQKKMIDQLSSGPAVALEVRQDNVVDKLRKLCGPYDPEIARKLEPTTIRARFGSDRVLNAVHCTDLAEDGRLEVQYVFGTLLG